MELTAETVEETFATCLDNLGDVEVEGIAEKVTFNKAILGDHAELIAALLLELPDEFKSTGGGGWSFDGIGRPTFPDMSDRKNVRYDKGSGAIFIGPGGLL